jgi:excisionase family DNA binding protein
MTTTETNLLTRHEAAAAAAVSLRKIDSLIAARAIDYVKIGKTVRISREALHRFIESRTVSCHN